jgi:26S proteasome regulatory subunit N12
MSLETLCKTLDEQMEGGDLAGSRATLSAIKLSLAKQNMLVPTADVARSNESAFRAGRHAVESGALLSLRSSDVHGFERNVAQAKSYYSVSADGSRCDLILGLNLVRLLSSGKRAEFHVELETIPAERKSGPHIKNALELEQCVVEGSFHKVFEAQERLPAFYALFMDHFVHAIREELASCIEKAYRSIPLDVAARMLHIRSSADTDDLTASAESTLVNYVNGHSGWTVKGDQLFFEQSSAAAATAESSCAEIPANELLQRTLFYAHEFERIV